MSARIEQIIEVIKEVRDNFRNKNEISSVSRIRINACHSVASRRNISMQSVVDKFIRQLRPDIGTTLRFDMLLEKWLVQDSPELRNIILKHKYNRNDEDLIKNTFYKVPEQDILLSEEFGINPNDVEFREGKEKLRIHLTKERNQYLVKSAKEKWAKENNGHVVCAVCSFSFVETYGDIGQGYIEAHHMLPISSLTPDIIIKVSDLTPICSNCHSIIHRHRLLLTINQLKDAIMKVKKIR